MKKEATEKILNLLNVAYPSVYRDMSRSERQQTAYLYYEQFRDEDERIVLSALKQYVATNEYPPTIAGLNRIISAMNPENETVSKLWNDAMMVLRRASVFTKEEFDGLSDPLKEWFGGIGGVRQYAMMQITDVDFLRNYFVKTIGDVKDRQTAQRLMPSELKGLMDGRKEIEG